MAQTKLCFCLAEDLDYQIAFLDLLLQQQAWHIQLLSFLHEKEGKN